MKKRMIILCSVTMGFVVLLVTILLIINRKVDVTCESFDDKSSYTIYGVRNPNVRMHYPVASYKVNYNDKETIINQLDTIYQDENNYYILEKGYYYRIYFKEDHFIFTNLFASYYGIAFAFPIITHLFDDDSREIDYASLSLDIHSFNELKKFYEVDPHATINEDEIIIQAYSFIRHTFYCFCHCDFYLYQRREL